MRILKEIRVSKGEQVPLDRIEAEIRRAIQYDKEDKLAYLKSLLDSGRSLIEILEKNEFANIYGGDDSLSSSVPRNPRMKNPILLQRKSHGPEGA